MHDLMLESSRPAVGTLCVTSPFDGRELGQVATSGPDHVNDAMSTAHALFRDKDQWLPIQQRIEILNKAATIMRAQTEELTLLAASEGGQTLQGLESGGDPCNRRSTPVCRNAARSRRFRHSDRHNQSRRRPACIHTKGTHWRGRCSQRI